MVDRFQNITRYLSKQNIGKYLSKLREKSRFDRLEPRERLIVTIGGCVFLVFLILQFIVAPYLEATQQLDRSLASRKGDIVELQLLQQEYQQLQVQAGGIREKLEKRSADFSLFTFLDSQATATAIKNYISYMKPSTTEGGETELIESMVEMKIQEIPLEQLVNFLKAIESPENVVSIKRVSLQQSGQQSNALDAILQIITFVDNG
ncbi:MAG: type II secretion system protein GspM [Desulfocapsaceae bacterium]|nr:type II secretion system protein GspM [Desulfocapsaceae bacterium]